MQPDDDGNAKPMYPGEPPSSIEGHWNETGRDVPAVDGTPRFGRFGTEAIGPLKRLAYALIGSPTPGGLHALEA
jgi:hypothetical protein